MPLAIVHGKNDPNVSFDGGTYAYGLFRDAGWPAVRLFDHATAGHMFGLLPVGPAIRWLEAMSSDKPAVLLDFADKRLKEHGYRDAIAALRHAQGWSLDAPAKARLAKLEKTVKDTAAPKAKTYLATIRANKDSSWVDGFLAFRDDFEFADAATDAMAAFNELRAQQEKPAAELMGEARGLFQRGATRRRIRQGEGSRRQVLCIALVSPGQEMAGGAEVIRVCNDSASERAISEVTRSVEDCIPTQSMGTSE